MNLYEYEAKEILAQYGVPVPEGRSVTTAADAEAAAKALPGHKFAVKAQILAGGRGLAGGVELAPTPSKAGEIAKRMLGSRLVTKQTGAEGEVVERVYVETAVDSRKDFFLAVLVDQALAQIVVLGSKNGGVDFEDRVLREPGIVETLPVDSNGSLDDTLCDVFLNRLGISGDAAAEARGIIEALVKVFRRIDATLIEINPLTLTSEGTFAAVDAKVSIDNNALFRHPEFAGLASSAGGDEIEMQAQKDEINLVRLDGNIGVVVNGAGLALATQDGISDAGGKAANFMDIRTTATSLQVARGIGILLNDPNVKSILVNIHGGGMTPCDTIAEALALALAWSDRKVPVVTRLAGHNADYARQMLVDRGVPHERCDTMQSAISAAIARAA
ncbi:MAG: ADP-forming succinate--CoA ligase subunit beta [Rhodospirillales bacterium]|nr:ADP-forming succinate--CoA ligase subunit beta [Rhodospirillales bacterium]